jgi:RNA 3'-terminal phosphate cyclase (ATP)
MIEIDGSFGEGGGQILRSSLALSIITATPVRIYNVRANRKKPGLLPQHLTAVNAAVEISNAEIKGAKLGSRELTFNPGKVAAGDYNFDIGTAGSTTLVFQTVLPPLMLAGSNSSIRLSGGTHNPMAPPFEFLETTFIPLLNQMGVKIDTKLERYGFYPKGGGVLRFKIAAAESGKLTALHLDERGPVTEIEARSLVVNLPETIAERELATIEDILGKLSSKKVIASDNSIGQGNVAFIHARSQQVTETFTRIGERGVRAETVAGDAATEARHYLDSSASVGEHLADQLLIPMALCGEGSFLTTVPSLHTTTNISIIERFLDLKINSTEQTGGLWKIQIGR